LANKTRHFKRLCAGCLGMLLLSGWGVAAAVSTPNSALTGVSRLIVAGDSLADVGTFGFKYTVQDAANPAGFPVFPELVAAAYGLSATCSHYMDNGAGGVIPRGDPACTNFAVGGGRILHRGDGPQGIPAQLRDAAATVGGRFDSGDLVLMAGGGKDATDLAVAYLAGTTSRAGMLAFLAFLAREVDVSALLFTAPGDASLARSANLYMEKAADALVEAVVANALDRGATRVAVLNVPDITLTPLFSAAFAKLVQESGADEATAIQAAVRQAVGAYNARLQSRLGNDARVVLIDVRAAVDDQIARAGDYGLSDARHAACPVTGVNFAGLPEWTLRTCTSALLDAASPGVAPGWWATWAFSDGFHPTPAGHRLLAATVNQALAAASWP
jgi:outer membrane lipase/esterase